MLSPNFKRGFAVAAVVLATGGLVLYKSPLASGHGGTVLAQGKNAVLFGGPGARGSLALSHTKTLAGTRTPLYAELRLVADASERGLVRAPTSLAVVVDTSGSMSGEKLEDAKRSVAQLLSSMRDEDEIALVRYSDTSELIQPLARVGQVRSTLAERIRGLASDGGTNIPGGLAHGLRALEVASKGRVRRIVLVSDGLDGTRVEAENVAHASFASGITVSSLGIGLDFDESYMGAVAQSGHGNFAFVKDGSSLAGFLKRELDETSSTTVENAEVRLELPRDVRFVSATGADVDSSDGRVRLRLGSLFAGDERRIIVELEATGDSTSEIAANASWSRVGRGESAVAIPTLTLAVTHDQAEVDRGRDGAVYASATSVVASKRQLEASNAFASGDVDKATALTQQNEAALGDALAAAPSTASPALAAQLRAYGKAKQSYRTVAPSSAAGKTMSKSGSARDFENLNRNTSF